MTQLPYRIKPGYNGIVIELPDNAIVADVGFGGDPVKGATYYIDMDLEESIHRNGEVAAAVPREKFIQCDVDKSNIPLPDKCCDFVVASHIAEHIHEPEHLCSEMERIGKAGYIETPGIVVELMSNYPHHLWWVTKVSDKIIFIKKPAFFTDNGWKVPCVFPFNILYHLFRNTCYRWDGEIKRVVIK
jgi:SAM-dependent methyltransferase